MIVNKLPKIEALISMVEKFEEDNNRQFTMYGIRIQDIIERDYVAKRQEKLTKSGKKVYQHQHEAIWKTFYHFSENEKHRLIV
jgi:predicted helicase